MQPRKIRQPRQSRKLPKLLKDISTIFFHTFTSNPDGTSAPCNTSISSQVTAESQQSTYAGTPNQSAMSHAPVLPSEEMILAFHAIPSGYWTQSPIPDAGKGSYSDELSLASALGAGLYPDNITDPHPSPMVPPHPPVDWQAQMELFGIRHHQLTAQLELIDEHDSLTPDLGSHRSAMHNVPYIVTTDETNRHDVYGDNQQLGIQNDPTTQPSRIHIISDSHTQDDYQGTDPSFHYTSNVTSPTTNTSHDFPMDQPIRRAGVMQMQIRNHPATQPPSFHISSNFLPQDDLQWALVDRAGSPFHYPDDASSPTPSTSHNFPMDQSIQGNRWPGAMQMGISNNPATQPPFVQISSNFRPQDDIQWALADGTDPHYHYAGNAASTANASLDFSMDLPTLRGNRRAGATQMQIQNYPSTEPPSFHIFHPQDDVQRALADRTDSPFHYPGNNESLSPSMSQSFPMDGSHQLIHDSVVQGSSRRPGIIQMQLRNIPPIQPPCFHIPDSHPQDDCQCAEDERKYQYFLQ